MSPTSTSAPLIEVDDLRVTYPERDSRGPVEAVRGLTNGHTQLFQSFLTQFVDIFNIS